MPSKIAGQHLLEMPSRRLIESKQERKLRRILNEANEFIRKCFVYFITLHRYSVFTHSNMWRIYNSHWRLCVIYQWVTPHRKYFHSKSKSSTADNISELESWSVIEQIHAMISLLNCLLRYLTWCEKKFQRRLGFPKSFVLPAVYISEEHSATSNFAISSFLENCLNSNLHWPGGFLTSRYFAAKSNTDSFIGWGKTNKDDAEIMIVKSPMCHTNTRVNEFKWQKNVNFRFARAFTAFKLSKLSPRPKNHKI